MLSANRIKAIRQLHQKKYRQKYHKFIVEGEKSVEELLFQKRLKVLELYAKEAFLEKIKTDAVPSTTELVGEQDLKKISLLQSPNQAFAVVEMPDTKPDFSYVQNHLCFYLDNLRDPGNVGTVMRIADWFGLPAVYCSKGTADVFSPKVIQATMGAFLRVRIFEVESETELPDVPLIGAVMDGDSLFSFKKKPTHGLIVVGNEGQGISAALESKLTQKLTIDRAENGGAESLNASVAAGIFAAFLGH